MAGFPVCPKSFLHLLDEREGKLCGVRPPIHFNVFFSFPFMSFLKHSPSPWLSARHQKFSRDFMVWISVVWLAQRYPCREACTSDSRLQLGVLILCALWYMSASPK